MSSETAPPGFSRTISYGGVSYKIYSHSFLHYGQVASESREYYNLLIRVSIRKRISILSFINFQEVITTWWAWAYRSTSGISRKVFQTRIRQCSAF